MMFEKNLTPRSRKVTITLPKEYVGKQIHITANLLESEKIKDISQKSLEDFFEPEIDTRKIKFSREDINKR